MIMDGNSKKRFLELNNGLDTVDSYEQTDGEQVGSGEDASPLMNKRGKDIKGGNWDAQLGQGVVQVSQQLTRGNSECWEKFLPVRSIKVLLVENDDATRHVVTALLRNCNYEVKVAANGLHAWKILEDLTNHIDLVLTEVVMPCVSGVGLLYKIMSHKTRKNVPVIMMSSHDSMGLVFKCLSKGAVDFLLKPIRKNELKNLWQHVWRRCHSSSGSDSECGTQAEAFSQVKSSDRSENGSGSNDAEENGSMSMNVVDSSDNGSGTQSSWKKQALELQSSQTMPTCDQVEEHPNSTCAQVIHPLVRSSSITTPFVSATLNCLEQENPAEIKVMMNSGTRTSGLESHFLVESPYKLHGRKQTCPSEMDSNTISKEKGELNLNGVCSLAKYKMVLTDTSDPHVDSRRIMVPKELSKASDMNDKVDSDYKGLSAPEINFKRSREVKDSGKALQDDCSILRPSAFSRYNVASTILIAPCENKQVIAVKEAEGTTMAHQGGSPKELPVRHLHHHCNSFLKDKPETTSNHDDFSFNKLTTDAPHCGSSNVNDGPIEVNAGNYSFNRSASGSNHGSNGQNGSSTVANAGGTNAGGTNFGSGRSGVDNASGSRSGDNIDQNKAAKRKERCFQKKVRYQSRKRLAEQRPRIRGQFVQRSDIENSSSSEDY
ncbi:two-component response regulator-like PRR73 [Impatiens glandulifera]|uniref:two-component response regulator-like PRR73 n=1 Tax=Impatiens glandulifera TaxID=253017 RepID=UPI001FB1375E|nr:two-component response regulator-like PRR73 [Impatiens glandulifera]